MSISICRLNLSRTKANDTMWLYQHSTRCLTAIQLFLDCHPEYWCFIPMKSDEANRENNILTSTTKQLPSKPIANNTLIDAIPKPPPGYTFSRRQIEQQSYFSLFMIDPMIPFTINVALYNMAIVAVRKFNFIHFFST
jgi:hypothetical protein